MFNISDKTYDFLSKFQRWMGTLGVLYLALCEIWHLPLGDKVNKTIAVFATFLASYLEISTVAYKKKQEQIKLAEILEDEMRPEDEINPDSVIHQAEEGEG